MSPERLLKHFEQISEAPDAIPRLRRFILDLAVRGKLVEQHPEDEPAEELLKKIDEEKRRLIKAGVVRNGKFVSGIDEETVPFEVPPSWSWVPVRRITVDRGQKIPNKKFSYIDVSSIDKERGRISTPKVLTPDEAPSRARKIVQKNDVIYSCVRPYLLNIAVVEEEFRPEPIVSTAFAVLNGMDFLVSQYLWMILRSSFFVDCVEEKMRGQAYPAINDNDFGKMPMPLPPLAEQHRIVAKVDELMKLCAEFESAQNRQEKRRDRLVSATLHGLNNGDSNNGNGTTFNFEESARFYFTHLPRLTARPEHIQQLRQTILNLAVRGKLVPQEGNDEPATSIVKRIEKEKVDLLHGEGVKKYKSTNALVIDPAPFQPPAGWTWVSLEKISELITKGSSPRWQGIDYVPRHVGILFITSENVGHYQLRNMTAAKYVEQGFNKIEPRSILRFGDILMNLVGASIGRTALYDLHDVANINQAVAVIRLINNGAGINKEFLLHYFNSPLAINLMLSSRVVTAQPNISLADVKGFPVPLPPFSEQQRIVEKVEEMMTLCDDLELRVRRKDAVRQKLLEAVLQEALEAND